MSSPVKPADINACVADPNSTLCGNFLNTLIKLPALLAQWWTWAFNADGTSTKALVNAVHQTGDLVMAACLQTEDGTRLLCDGRQVSQTTYADLYAKIGSTYGTASAGNFLLPDFRARFPVGIGTFPSSAVVALGVTGGEEKHALTLAELPSTIGKLPSGATGVWARQAGIGTTSITSANGSQDGLIVPPVGSDTPHNTIPPYLGVYVYIIT